MVTVAGKDSKMERAGMQNQVFLKSQMWLSIAYNLCKIFFGKLIEP